MRWREGAIGSLTGMSDKGILWWSEVVVRCRHEVGIKSGKGCVSVIRSSVWRLERCGKERHLQLGRK